MIYIIAAILIFGVLIAVHELGHFLAAKACGVRVNEFSIGMGPALLKKTKGDTQYSLRLLPIGGFCAMEGEEEDSDDPAALNNQGFWRKLLIFAAGALMNFLAGLIIILVLYAGVKAVNVPVIRGFAEGCPLESAAGLQEGDRILSIDGERIGQGRDSAKQYLIDHPDVADRIEQEIRDNMWKLQGKNAKPPASAAAKPVSVSADDFNDD